MSAIRASRGALIWSSGAPTAPWPESFCLRDAPKRETASATELLTFKVRSYSR